MDSAHDALLDELRKWQAGADDALEGTSLPDAAQTSEQPPSSSPRRVVAQAAMGATPPIQSPPAAGPRNVDIFQPLGYSAPATGADSEMASAMEQDKRSKAMGKLGQAVTAYTEAPSAFLSRMTGRGSGGTGTMPHNPLWDEQAKSGEGAVGALTTQRQSDAAMEAAQAAKQKAAEMRDPNSATAKSYRAVLLKFSPGLAEQLNGASPEQMEKIAPWLQKFAAEENDLLVAKAKAEAKAKEDEERKALHKEERAENVADRRAATQSAHELAAAGLGLRKQGELRDQEKFEAEKAEKAGGRPLPTSTLTDLADARTAISSLKDLESRFNELQMSGWASKVADKASNILDLQDTDSAKYRAVALNAMQGVGKIMEGGKLAAGDEIKYRAMLPRAGDSKELAHQKTVDAMNFLSTLVDNRERALQAGGYKVTQPGGPTATSVSTPPAAGTKTVGGVTYEKRADGKWHPVGGE